MVSSSPFLICINCHKLAISGTLWCTHYAECHYKRGGGSPWPLMLFTEYIKNAKKR